MMGAFIATVSAVSAVNRNSLGAVAWPTVALMPLVGYQTRTYGK